MVAQPLLAVHGTGGQPVPHHRSPNQAQGPRKLTDSRCGEARFAHFHVQRATTGQLDRWELAAKRSCQSGASGAGAEFDSLLLTPGS